MTSGYWELASEFKPLVHTWSLAVEEQFYILFPLLILALWRLKKTIVFLAILALFAASLVASEILSKTDPSANFYLLYTRAWELLAGSICAFIQYKKVQKPYNVLSAFGLLLILFSIFYYDDTTPFPSLYALAPVLGTAFILLFGTGKTWTARILSTKYFVGIGLFSYSAYLWHQPFFAFARINSYNPPAPALMFVLSILSLACAYVSWKYVETPFRCRDTISLRPFIIVISLTSFALAAFGLTLHVQHGIPGRMFAFDDKATAAGMHIAFNHRVFAYDKANFPENENKNVLVVGDSFARDFINAGVETGHFTHHNIIYREEFKHCLTGFANSIKVYEELLSTTDIVIISFDTYNLDCLKKSIEFLKKEKRSLQILVIGGKDFGYNLNKFMQLRPDERIYARTKMLDKVIAQNKAMKELLPPDIFVDIINILSEDGISIPVFTRDGYLISQDRKHLTRKGAQFIGEKIFQHPLLQQFSDPAGGK